MKFAILALMAGAIRIEKKDTTDVSQSNPSAPINAHAEYMYNVTKIGADNYATVPRAGFAQKKSDPTDPTDANPGSTMNKHAEYMYKATFPEKPAFAQQKGTDPTENSGPHYAPINKHAETMYNITNILPHHFGTASLAQYDIHEEYQPTDPTPRFPPQETVIPAHPGTEAPINNHAHTMYNITKIMPFNFGTVPRAGP